MSPPPTCTLSSLAYTKLTLHAFKHPHQPVLGLLLGTGTDIRDAVPLLHHWTSLSPMTEIGLDLARGHAENRGLQVVGLYQAAEKGTGALGSVAERVLAQLQESVPRALALVIDGDEPVLVPHPPATLAFDPALPARVLQLARGHGLQRLLGDFDDHLEDVRVDWLRGGDVEAALAKLEGAA